MISQKNRVTKENISRKISVNVIIMQSIVIMVNDPGSGSHSLITRNHTQKSLELTVELKELLNYIHDLRIHV